VHACADDAHVLEEQEMAQEHTRFSFPALMFGCIYSQFVHSHIASGIHT
jgi:hypothetical protein